jgi:hypothetical protein
MYRDNQGPAIRPRPDPGPRCPEQVAATDFHPKGGEVQSDVWKLKESGPGFVLLTLRHKQKQTVWR